MSLRVGCAFRAAVLLGVSWLASSVLTGCGMGVTSPSGLAPAAKASGVSGKLHGGPNAITGANITLWETWTSGISGTTTGRGTIAASSTYGSKAYALATTTSDSTGYWAFPGFQCDSGEYLYVTATGGKTASNAANANEVLIAPIGACAGLPSALQVDVSELSTLAVAYTLDYFMTEDSSHVGDGQELVYIGAPAANNASVGSCTGTGSAMTCVASGLGQAFANAISLVNSVNYNGTKPAGTVNTVPTDAYGNVPNATGSIPAALLNTLGNALQSCVNTSGGTAAGAPSSGCGKLFAATAVNSVAPTDTLQAALNIARYPANNVPAIYPLATPIGVFTPALTAQPTDFSLAITYTGSDASHTTAYAGASVVAFTANDTVLMSRSYKVEPAGTVYNLYGLYPNMQQWGDNASPAGYYPLAVDNNGNAYTNSGFDIERYSATTLGDVEAISGAALSTVEDFAVDRNNTLYASYGTTGLGIYTPNTLGTALTGVGTTTTTPVILGAGGEVGFGLAFDANQNLWVSFSSSSNGLLGEKFSAGVGCTPPTFCSTTNISNSAAALVPLVAADGTVWFTSQTGTYHVSSSGSLLNTYTLPTAISTTVEGSAIDGSGMIFAASLSPIGTLVSFSTTAQTWSAVQPCSLGVVASSQATTCGNALTVPFFPAIDATGTVWLPDPYGYGLVKVFGIAAPSWPYLGYGHPGEMPH